MTRQPGELQHGTLRGVLVAQIGAGRLHADAVSFGQVNGGPPGDLYVLIRVREHALFKRHNNEVICEVPISFPQAALGAEIEVPTLEGKLKMKVPPGTQSGNVFRLRGKGIADLHSGGRGDQLVRVVVEVPRKLTARQRELLEEFARLDGADLHPLSKGFFEKVKELFG